MLDAEPIPFAVSGQIRARLGRPADRVEAVTASLRELIISRLQPGDRLPSRREVQLSHGIAIATVQRAFDRLSNDGFIRASGRGGTFVVDRPPHLHRVIVAFPISPAESCWVGMWSAIAAAVRSHPGNGFAFEMRHNYERDPAEQRRLAEEVRDRRLAGLIFASDPWPLEGHPALHQSGLARAAIAPVPRAGIPAVALGGSSEAFIVRALDRVLTAGRRRPALITTPGHAGLPVAMWRSRLGDHGLVCDEQLIQVVAHSEAPWIANLVKLLLRLPAGQRPDSLVVSDDHLAQGVIDAISAAGVRVPEDMHLVLHSNFPLAQPDPIAAERLGYDLPSAFAACVDLIERQRRGERVAERTLIPPRFADEPAPEPIPA